MADPDPFRHLRKQQEQLRKMLNPPALKLLQEQERRMRDMLDPPALRAIRERERRMRDMLDPPAIRMMRQQQARMQSFFESPVYRSLTEQRERLEEMLSPPIVAEVENHQAQLMWRISKAAEQEAADAGEDESVWFGAPSWSVLLWEIEGLLKTLELMTAGMAGAKMELDAPIPGVILAVLVMLILAGELALFLAKGPPDEEE